PDDLVKFGLIPELIGRLPMAVALKELTKEDLTIILTEPKNSIVKQFKASFAYDNVELDFTADAIDAIADTAIKHKTGARGLRSIVEKLLLDIMFEVPSVKDPKKLMITKDVVLQIQKADISLLEDQKAS
ncbi:MAG TPA: ATP-dependent Clp protease ATP-binding subunit ClpX, partial [Treponemataceae bacterium]|nr:ATP-dependent Clp protease ATP-binding subunit ClpX [Treponemataceae bacterium]